MQISQPGADSQQTTAPGVVVPFYAYAALSLLLACALLFLNEDLFTQHHFHPHTLAITHLMALGWGSMMILGASYQLLPVLIESKLSSPALARCSFAFAAVGIPLLVVGFYSFHTGWPMQAGAILVNLGVVCFVVNVWSSIWERGSADVHSIFMATAALWLLSTTFFGLLLVLNLSIALLPADSLSYLSLHAHMGIVGWFLLLVTGVASRLIPLFLISKYSNNRRLWWIFGLINGGLGAFILLRCMKVPGPAQLLPLLPIAAAISLFGRFCYQAWKSRIRKNVDEQMKVSLLSVALMAASIISLVAMILFLASGREAPQVGMLYGFSIFFGWLTALILGMTFKTLPFIIWNKVYHQDTGKTPAPKDLFSAPLFRWMSAIYLIGYVLVVAGAGGGWNWLLKSGTLCLLAAAVLYVCNVAITLTHKRGK